MAASIPFMPFLRPLALPRPTTVQRFLRYSTASAQQSRFPTRGPKEDRNLRASRRAPSSYPPESMFSDPRPKISKASRRAAHPPKERNYPTRTASHNKPEQPKLIAAAVEPLPAEQCAPNLAYFVTRTRSMELPIYLERKRGGNLKQTRLKKIDGSVETLRDELRVKLGLDQKTCVINPITKHIVMKGHFKPQVDHYLRERLF